MSAILLCALVLASWLALSPQASPARRISAALPPDLVLRAPDRMLPGRARQDAAYVPMTAVVQQLAALLKGGRAPARVWDELWLLYSGNVAPGGALEHLRGPALAPASLALLAAARAAALRGSSVAEALRGTGADGSSDGRQADADVLARGVWAQLAACFEIAEASGCPLADVLTRFAAQLEAEDDAEAARQTALAGPRATVRLLSWLPLLGLGLGILLGVDPASVLLGSPYGIAALVLGAVLTAAGRMWSARLVRVAAGPQ